MSSNKIPIFFTLLVLSSIIFTCSQEKDINSISLSIGDLTATFVNNEAIPPVHRAGYNGIARLTHREQDSTIFVPLYAGFNLEHIFGSDSLIEVFEPRKHPMKISQQGPKSIELYQSPTPLSHVESKTIFELKPPHYIDVDFEFMIRDRSFFTHGWVGLFWASYIHEPEDKHIYFWGTAGAETRPGWIAAFSEKHGYQSTHLSRDDNHHLYFAENFNPPLLVHNFSNYRFHQPFYYGRFRNMVLIYMFDNDQDIRFSQSPTGGGPLNPAWDFQFIIEPFEINKVYQFKARIVYKPFMNQLDVIEEFEKWQQALTEES